MVTKKLLKNGNVLFFTSNEFIAKKSKKNFINLAMSTFYDHIITFLFYNMTAFGGYYQPCPIVI